MQVFLPSPDFQTSVSCLDPKRLGNQIYREALTLIRGGWQNHPVSRMWANYKHALAKYALFGLEELTRRGRHYPIHIETFKQYLKEFPDTGLPPFVGNEKFHSSHRASLLFKNPEWYGKFGWKEEPKIDLFYPLDNIK